MLAEIASLATSQMKGLSCYKPTEAASSTAGWKSFGRAAKPLSRGEAVSVSRSCLTTLNKYPAYVSIMLLGKLVIKSGGIQK